MILIETQIVLINLVIYKVFEQDIQIRNPIIYIWYIQELVLTWKYMLWKYDAWSLLFLPSCTYYLLCQISNAHMGRDYVWHWYYTLQYFYYLLSSIFTSMSCMPPTPYALYFLYALYASCVLYSLIILDFNYHYTLWVILINGEWGGFTIIYKPAILG